jgi:hypothetical protein
MFSDECAAGHRSGLESVRRAWHWLILLVLTGALLTGPAAAQARPTPQPGDTVELRTSASSRSVQVAVVRVAAGRADVVEAGRYYALFSALPLDTLDMAGMRIGRGQVAEMVVRAPAANVPLEWLHPPVPRGRRLPSLQLLVGFAAWGGALGATAGLWCDCDAVGRGAARGAAAFTVAAVVLAGLR